MPATVKSQPETMARIPSLKGKNKPKVESAEEGPSSSGSNPDQGEPRLAEELCDAVIQVKSVEFKVHKVILSRCCPYFEALFFRWSDQSQRVYSVKDIIPEIMELIVKFAYTGSFSIRMDNVGDLMLTADQYNISEIVQTCSQYLEEQLRLENCLSIWKMTRICYLPALRLKACRFIMENFPKVVTGREFSQLTAEELAHLLERDDLMVKAESIVYECVIKWISRQPKQRKRYLCDLMAKVRLCLMNKNYISRKVMSNNLVKSDSRCLDMVAKASRILKHFANKGGDIMYSIPHVRPRLPSAVLFVTGGWKLDKPVETIRVFDIRVNRWSSLTPSNEPTRTHHSVVFLDGYVYYVGGFSGDTYLNAVHRFDPATKAFEVVAKMRSRRCVASVTVFNGMIYALGGYNGQWRLNSAECYHPQKNRWKAIAHMDTRRSGAGCAVYQEKIYVFGGYSGTESMAESEFYNTKANQWTRFSRMSTRRRGHGAVTYKDRIYVIGGCEGQEDLCSGEVFNPSTNTWTKMSSMKTPRSHLCVEVLEDRILAVGGSDCFHSVDAVECYDPALDRWTDACDMPNPQRTLTCCVVHGLRNMADYTFNREDLPYFDPDEDEEAPATSEL